MSGKIWMEHDALAHTEYVGGDESMGKRTPFPQCLALEQGELIVFSWILLKSRREGDRMNKKVMADPCLKDMMDAKALPFDGKQMSFAGFKSTGSLRVTTQSRSGGTTQCT